MYRRTLLLSFLFLGGLGSMALGQTQQNLYHSNQDFVSSIRVEENGKHWRLAWGGGFNQPQFAQADLNRDGKLDLVVYETFKGVKTFLSTGSAGNPEYRYAPEYEWLFPEVWRYLKLIDYNCDQIEDLFHFGSSGVAIADGYINKEGNLSFHPSREIRYKDPFASGMVNIHVNGADMPAIIDIDHDGDLDIISFAMNGFYVTHFVNQREELGLPCDTFAVLRKDNCWGRMRQDTAREHKLHLTCNNSGLKTSGEKTTHGNNLLCLFDVDGDGDYDALVGNPLFNDIQFLRNGKADFAYPVDTMLSQDTAWKTGEKSIYMPAGPAAYWLDIDLDGDKDILISPSGYGSLNYRNVAFFENKGSDASPDFRFQTEEYLVEEMIDMGFGSYPHFYDYNRDGKLDLFIGSAGFFTGGQAFHSKIAYLENTSQGGQLSFEIVDKDFLNLGSLNLTGTALAIGDINDDGLDELVIGTEDGSLYYLENRATRPRDVPDWNPVLQRLKDYDGIDIKMVGNAAPFIYDINGDGKPDLIIGSANGKLAYYENSSLLPGNLRLKLVTDFLGEVFVGTGLNPKGYSVPFIGPIDNSQVPYLMVGNNYGDIARYDGFLGNTTAPFVRLDSVYSGISTHGHFSAPAFVDLDGDGFYELFLGGEMGGIEIFKQWFPVSVEEVEISRQRWLVYPNPAGDRIQVQALNGQHREPGLIRIYDALGVMRLQVPTRDEPGQQTLDIRHLSPGLYILVPPGGSRGEGTTFIKH